jgi:hypothetical protein
MRDIGMSSVIRHRMKLFVLVLLLCPLIARAEIGKRPYPAVAYIFEQQTSPKPQKIFVAVIDLTNPMVSVHVARGGADPDGDGKWQTTLTRPTKVADREGFDVVVNGDFFSHLSGKDAEGEAAQKEFRSGIPARVTGPAVSDGKVWGPTTRPRAALMFDREKRPSIRVVRDVPSDAVEAIGGSNVIVKDGKNVAPPGTKPGLARGPHPRTAVGIADDGKTLLLVVVDGRRKDEAIGMSLSELAEVMIKYGAKDAINLDGGGSSMLGIRDPQTHKMRVMNTPSDGHERFVANVLGVTVTRRATPTTRSAH